MDTRNWKVAPAAEFKKWMPVDEFNRYVRPVDMNSLTPRARRLVEQTGHAQISRNSPCPCGSRKRFKRCCMAKE